MSTPNFYAAVYAIIRDESGRILFSQRKNSKFYDGKFQLPAGHMDGNESMTAAMRRELQEELSIDTEESDMRIIHISHGQFPGREYFNIFIEVAKYNGVPKINEPEKCWGLEYFDIDAIDPENFVNYDIDAIRFAQQSISFSECNLTS